MAVADMGRKVCIRRPVAEELFGGPVPQQLPTHIWLHVRLAGARERKDASIVIKLREEDEWLDHNLFTDTWWARFKARRQADEAASGHPWEDGVWSNELD